MSLVSTLPPLKDMVPGAPFHHDIGIRYADSGENWISLELPYHTSLDGYGEPGVVSGGAVFTLMDATSGMAVMVKRNALAPMATLDLRLDYLRPANAGENIRSRVECYRLTRRFGFTRGIAYNDDPNHPIAHASGIFIISGV